MRSAGDSKTDTQIIFAMFTPTTNVVLQCMYTFVNNTCSSSFYLIHKIFRYHRRGHRLSLRLNLLGVRFFMSYYGDERSSQLVRIYNSQHDRFAGYILYLRDQKKLSSDAELANDIDLTDPTDVELMTGELRGIYLQERLSRREIRMQRTEQGKIF